LKLFQWAKDGGPESHVDAFFIVEIKPLFSIAILRFNEGTRENFHSHAFNAWTLWLGDAWVAEETPDGKKKFWHGGTWKFTPRTLMHRVRAVFTSYALTFRGPWVERWEEYNEQAREFTVLTNHRQIVDRYSAEENCG